MEERHTKLVLLLVLVLGSLDPSSVAQGATVTGRVTLYGGVNSSGTISAVVWLVRGLESNGDPPESAPPMHSVLRQKNKAFEPHLLVVTKGSTVDFPNFDPWFHNVFSLFNGKKFDLGLYEAGSTRAVHFDREGVSYVFCNIHPEMSAVVIVVSTPYYTRVAKDGEFAIAGVPPGHY